MITLSLSVPKCITPIPGGRGREEYKGGGGGKEEEEGVGGGIFSLSSGNAACFFPKPGKLATRLIFLRIHFFLFIPKY